MNDCRTQATWDIVGTLVHKLPPLNYRVPIRFDENIIEVLGVVKPRSDGRWGWWRHESRYHKDWTPGEPCEGVVPTEEIAKSKVLVGWDSDTLDTIERTFRPRVFNIDDTWTAVQVSPYAIYLYSGWKNRVESHVRIFPMVYQGRVEMNHGNVEVVDGVEAQLPLGACSIIFRGPFNPPEDDTDRRTYDALRRSVIDRTG